MKSVVIDANAFLRLFLNDIPKQADQVEKLILKAQKRHVRIIIPQIILFEIDFILRKYYSFEKQQVIEKLKSLLAVPYFLIESRNIFQKALLIYYGKNLSFVDCFLLSKAEQEKAELFTFDKDLKKLN